MILEPPLSLPVPSAKVSLRTFCKEHEFLPYVPQVLEYSRSLFLINFFTIDLFSQQDLPPSLKDFIQNPGVLNTEIRVQPRSSLFLYFSIERTFKEWQDAVHLVFDTKIYSEEDLDLPRERTLLQGAANEYYTRGIIQRLHLFYKERLLGAYELLNSDYLTGQVQFKLSDLSQDEAFSNYQANFLSRNEFIDSFLASKLSESLQVASDFSLPLQFIECPAPPVLNSIALPLTTMDLILQITEKLFEQYLARILMKKYDLVYPLHYLANSSYSSMIDLTELDFSEIDFSEASLDYLPLPKDLAKTEEQNFYFLLLTKEVLSAMRKALTTTFLHLKGDKTSYLYDDLPSDFRKP